MNPSKSQHMIKGALFCTALLLFLIFTQTHSQPVPSKSVFVYNGLSYYLNGGTVEIATWKHGSLGVFTAIHDDFGSSSVPGLNLHLDSIMMNRGLVCAPGIIPNDCAADDWELANKLVRHGDEIISHSLTHTNGMSETEMRESKRVIELNVPKQKVLFYIFPYDQWNDAAIQSLKNTGYLGARAGDRQKGIDQAAQSGTTPHMQNPENFADPFRLLFDVFPVTNSAYKNLPSNGDKNYTLKAYVKDAVDYKGWAIQELHDISSASSLCVPLNDYRAYMDYVKSYADKNELWASGPTEVIKYRFTREYCGAPSLTQTQSGYTISFGTPSNPTECTKYQTAVSVFFKSTGIPLFIQAQQNGQVIPSKKIADNYFYVDANPLAGNVTIAQSSKEYAPYPFLDPFDTIPSVYPAWSSAATYLSGNIVYYKGKEYKAKWWNQNSPPGTSGSPWDMYRDVSNLCAVTSRAAAHGRINPLGKTICNKGTNLSFTIAADQGYTIDYVNVDGVNQGSITSYSFTNIQKHHTIEAVFTQYTVALFTISASAGANGSITPAGTITVAQGSQQIFSITPNTGYMIDYVSVDGVNIGAQASYTFSNVSANHTIQAFFKNIPVQQWTITATANANGAITPSGAVVVNQGSSKTFTIASNAGYVVDYVLVDQASIGAQTSYTFAAITANHTIEAFFRPVVQYSLSTATGPNGSISPSGPVFVNEGGSLTFTIIPNSGYAIDYVSIDGSAIGAPATYTFTNVAATHSIEAYFKVIPVYTITAYAGANGTISPSGSVTVSEGKSQTFTITPNAGYVVDYVVIDGVNSGAQSSYTFSAVTASHTIDAYFKVKPVTQYTITASAGANGTISPAGSVAVNEGSSQTFTMTPNAGYVIDKLIVDGTTIAAQSTYTFAHVTANHTISVSFKIKQYTITASAGANGTISPTGAVKVNSGSSQTFTITGNTGYVVDYLTVDGTKGAAQASYTFSTVTADHTIQAAFKTGSGVSCTGVKAWDPNQSWTTYKVGDRRVNAGKLWECIAVAYSYYEPSSANGKYGWKLIGTCN